MNTPSELPESSRYLFHKNLAKQCYSTIALSSHSIEGSCGCWHSINRLYATRVFEPIGRPLVSNGEARPERIGATAGGWPGRGRMAYCLPRLETACGVAE